MSTNNSEDLIKILQDTMSKVLQTPGTLEKLGIPDVVRVSPFVWNELQKQVSDPNLPNLSGLTVELDVNLTGEQWELGPKRPSEAQPSEGDAGGSATEEVIHL